MEQQLVNDCSELLQQELQASATMGYVFFIDWLLTFTRQVHFCHLLSICGRLSQKAMSILIKNFLLILLYTFSQRVCTCLHLFAFIWMKDWFFSCNGHRLIKVNIFYIVSGSPVSDLPVREGEYLKSFMRWFWGKEERKRKGRESFPKLNSVT